METYPTLLASFTYPHEAHMAKTYLEANGIASVLADEMTVVAHPFYSNAIGGVKIKIEPANYETGISILTEGGFIQRQTGKIKLETIPYATECPFCQSENIDIKRTPRTVTIILYFILGALFPIMKSNMICYDCNKSWKFKSISSTAHKKPLRQ